MQQLHPKSFAFACSVTWALGLSLLSLISMVHGSYGRSAISVASSMYLGYDPTIPGLIIGAVWGLIDGFICGYVLASLYNYFLKTA